MKIKQTEKEPWYFHRIKLLDGRILTEFTLEEEEKKRGKEIVVEWLGHVFAKSPITRPKGVTHWREVEE